MRFSDIFHASNSFVSNVSFKRNKRTNKSRADVLSYKMCLLSIFAEMIT